MTDVSSEITMTELFGEIQKQAYYNNLVSNIDPNSRADETRKYFTFMQAKLLGFQTNQEDVQQATQEIKQAIGAIHFGNAIAFADKYFKRDEKEYFKTRRAGKVVGMWVENFMSGDSYKHWFDEKLIEEHVNLLVKEETILDFMKQALNALIEVGNDSDEEKDKMRNLLRQIQPDIVLKTQSRYTRDNTINLDSGLVKFHEELMDRFGGKYENNQTSGVRKKLEEYYSSLNGDQPEDEYTITDAQKEIADIAKRIWKAQYDEYNNPYTEVQGNLGIVRHYEKADITINENLLIDQKLLTNHISFNLYPKGDEISDLLHPKIPALKKPIWSVNPFWADDTSYKPFDLTRMDPIEQKTRANLQQLFYNGFANSVHMARRCYYVWRADAAHKYVEGLFADYSGEDKEARKAKKYEELGLNKFDLDTDFLKRLDKFIDGQKRIAYQDSQYELSGSKNLFTKFLEYIDFDRKKHMNYEEFNEKWAKHHDSTESDRIMAAVQKLCQIRMKARKSTKRDTDPYDPEKSHIIFAAARNPYLVIPDKPLLTNSTYVV